MFLISLTKMQIMLSYYNYNRGKNNNVIVNCSYF